MNKFPPNSSSQKTASPAKSTYRRLNRAHSSGTPRRLTTVISAPVCSAISRSSASCRSSIRSRRHISASHVKSQNTMPLAPSRFSTRSGQAHWISTHSLPCK